MRITLAPQIVCVAALLAAVGFAASCSGAETDEDPVPVEKPAASQKSSDHLDEQAGETDETSRQIAGRTTANAESVASTLEPGDRRQPDDPDVFDGASRVSDESSWESQLEEASRQLRETGLTPGETLLVTFASLPARDAESDQKLGSLPRGIYPADGRRHEARLEAPFPDVVVPTNEDADGFSGPASAGQWLTLPDSVGDDGWWLEDDDILVIPLLVAVHHTENAAVIWAFEKRDDNYVPLDHSEPVRLWATGAAVFEYESPTEGQPLEATVLEPAATQRVPAEQLEVVVEDGEIVSVDTERIDDVPEDGSQD